MSAPGQGDAKVDGPARAQVFKNLFGEPAQVVPDPDDAFDLSPQIEVAIHPPGHGDRDFYTLVTRGMSDAPMVVPPDLGAPFRRAELVVYVDVPGPTIVRLLQTIARLPHQSRSWLGHGHTIPNGDPPAPLFPGSSLDTVLILDPIVAPERHVREQVVVAGDPLNLLWLFPLTSAEASRKVESGLSVLLELFNREQISFVLDPQRPSLVPPAGS